jgi:predicted PurR-regulated permease PerM
MGVAASVGQAVVVRFIAYFLMVSGSRFRRKRVKIAGPTFAQNLGTLVLAAGSALVAFVQFGTLDGALLVAGLATGLHVISGNLLTP